MSPRVKQIRLFSERTSNKQIAMKLRNWGIYIKIYEHLVLWQKSSENMYLLLIRILTYVELLAAFTFDRMNRKLEAHLNIKNSYQRLTPLPLWHMQLCCWLLK